MSRENSIYNKHKVFFDEYHKTNLKLLEHIK